MKKPTTSSRFLLPAESLTDAQATLEDLEYSLHHLAPDDLEALKGILGRAQKRRQDYDLETDRLYP